MNLSFCIGEEKIVFVEPNIVLLLVLIIEVPIFFKKRAVSGRRKVDVLFFDIVGCQNRLNKLILWVRILKGV